MQSKKIDSLTGLRFFAALMVVFYVKLPARLKSLLNLQTLSMCSTILLGCLIRLVNGPQTGDDAYITFRYVENIVNGNGFVFNTGEHVLGTTTPLYTLILASIYFISGFDLPWTSLILNTVSDCVTIYLLCKICRKLFPKLNVPRFFELVPSLLFSISVISTDWCIANMETSVFSCLLISALYWHLVKQNDLATVTFASLATLCRPEGGVMLALVLVIILITNRTKFLRCLIASLVICSPWLLFATFYFGSPIPESFLAKSAGVYTIQGNFISNFDTFLKFLIDNPIGQLIETLPFSSAPLITGTLVLLIAPLVLCGEWVLLKLCNIRALLIAAFPFAVIGFYGLSVFKTPALLFPWYPAPLVPWLLLLLTACFAGIWRSQATRSGFAGKLARGLVISLIIISVINQLQAYDFGRSRMKPRGYYAQAAIYLAPFLAVSGGIVAAPEIGEFGYYSKGKILDTVGLVSPEALKYYPAPFSETATSYAIPTRLIDKENPEYVLSLEIFIRKSLLQSPTFLDNYSLLKSWPNSTFDSHGLFIYVRNDIIIKR